MSKSIAPAFLRHPPAYANLSLFVVLIGLLASHAVWESMQIWKTESSSEVDPTSLPSPKTVLTRTLADTTYTIPAGYLHDPSMSGADAGLLLTVQLPDMREVIPADISGGPAAGGAALSIFVQDLTKTTSFYDHFLAAWKIYRPTRELKNEFGLRRYLGLKDQSNTHEQDTSVISDKTVEEIYTDADGSKASIFITCDGDLVASASACEEVFADQNLLYILNYDKSRLQDWQTLKASALALIRTFASKSPSISSIALKE